MAFIFLLLPAPPLLPRSLLSLHHPNSIRMNVCFGPPNGSMVRTFGSSIAFILSTAKNSLTIQRSMKQELAVWTKSSSLFKCQLLSRLRVKKASAKARKPGKEVAHCRCRDLYGVSHGRWPPTPAENPSVVYLGHTDLLHFQEDRQGHRAPPPKPTGSSFLTPPTLLCLMSSKAAAFQSHPEHPTSHDTNTKLPVYILTTVPSSYSSEVSSAFHG